jgi:hypothetical protein
MNIFTQKPNIYILAFVLVSSFGFNACQVKPGELLPNNKPLRYFNFDFNGLKGTSKDPTGGQDALNNFNKSFTYHGIAGNFINVPSQFNARPNQNGSHFYNQRFFIKNLNDTLVVDVDIEFPIISGESLVFTKKSYTTGLFLRDGTIDVPNGLAANGWSGVCPTPENPQPSISLRFIGTRKTDGVFATTKYWQTVKSVPHNDVGSITIDEIDTINKTVKGQFKTTISSLYMNLTKAQYDKTVDPICKPELYKVDKSTLSGEFFVDYK